MGGSGWLVAADSVEKVGGVLASSPEAEKTLD
jgi:hypothetical protein